MPTIDFTSLPSWEQWIVNIGIILGVLTAIGLFIRKVWNINKAVVESLNWITVELPARLDAQDEALADIRHEVQYNNGSSVKDAIKRVEQTSERLEDGIKGLYKRADATDANAANLRTDLDLTKLPAHKPAARKPRTTKPKESL